MKGMKTQGSVLGRRITNFMILLGFFLIPPRASGHLLLQPRENRTGSHAGLLLEPRIGLFSTTSNFSEDGTLNGLSTGAKVTRTLFDLNLSYGLSDHLFLFGRASLISTGQSGGTIGRGSGFGLGDQLIGMAWRLLSTEGGTGVNLQAEARIPGYSNASAKAANRLYLGDGSVDLIAGAFIEFPAAFIGGSDSYFELGGAYTQRGAGFSSAIPLSLLFRRDPAYGGMMLDAGFRAQLSLNSDVATQNIAQRINAISDREQGALGSDLINGINPSWLAAHLRVGYKSSNGRSYFISGELPVAGSAVPSGILVSGGLVLDFNPQGGVDPSHESQRESRPRKPRTPLRGFQSYDLEAKVLSYNDQLYFVKIDHGSSDSVEKGQLFDIFSGKEVIARAKVSQVRGEEAILTVLEYFQDQWIEAGFVARRLLK
jgi:hypothetical protein